MIQVPFWWDGKTDRYSGFCYYFQNIKNSFSLAATIKAARSDLLTHVNVSCDPIPEKEPLSMCI